MTSRFVDVPGGRLFVVDEGSGPPIVLLHAGIADQRSWNDLAPLLNAAGFLNGREAAVGRLAVIGRHGRRVTLEGTQFRWRRHPPRRLAPLNESGEE